VSRRTKVAVIGVRGFSQQVEHYDVRSFPWNKLHRNQNLKDFDIVVISLLGSDQGRRINGDVFSDVWDDEIASAVVSHGGRVIVLGDPRFELTTKDDNGVPVSQPSWLGRACSSRGTTSLVTQ
jgi:hypothetical protein